MWSKTRLCVCVCVNMSVRRKAIGNGVNSSSPSDDTMNARNSLLEVFQQKASFSGAVGTTYDVEIGSDVSAVHRNIIMTGLTMSSSDSDKEWREDINYIINMIIARGFDGNIQVLKRTGDGPELTTVSIGIDVTNKEMTVIDNQGLVENFKLDKKDELINFLANHIKTKMKLKLIDTVFQVFFV